MNKLTIAIVATTLVLAASCNPPRVVQGTVLARSDDGTTLTVREELSPNQELVVTITRADVGAPPQVGDLVRIAYYERGKENTATRVMNLTRQAELAKKP